MILRLLFFFSLCGVLAYLLVHMLRPLPLLHLSSVPQAEVILDGQSRGLTPLILSGVGEGTHLVHFRRAGFYPVEQLLLFPRTRKLEVILAPERLAALEVSTQPADAGIYLDGVSVGQSPCRLEGLTPGRHSVEIIRTNYLPVSQDVVLTSGETGTISVVLESRQERAYRSRIAVDPFDLAAYNDLGEYLYVQGKFDAAAEIYVQGLIRAGEGARRGKAQDQQAIRRLDTEPRSRHRDEVFQEALDRREIEAVGRGESSALLLKDFIRIPSHRRTTLWNEAVEKFIHLHRANTGLLLEIAPLCQQAQDSRRTLLCLERIAELQPKDKTILLRCLGIGIDLYLVKPEAEVKVVLSALFLRLEALPSTPFEERDILFRRGLVQLAEADYPGGEALVKQALRDERSGFRSTEWRLLAAEKLISGKRYEAVGELIQPIAQARGVTPPQKTRLERISKHLPGTLPLEKAPGVK